MVPMSTQAPRKIMDGQSPGACSVKLADTITPGISIMEYSCGGFPTPRFCPGWDRAPPAKTRIHCKVMVQNTDRIYHYYKIDFVTFRVSSRELVSHK